MSLPLDVPFVPDTGYIDFLASCGAAIESVHFSLHDPGVSDARQLLEAHPLEDLITGLQELPHPQKYLLMNARLHAPDTYFDLAAIDLVADRISRLADASVLDGVLFADPYLLQALSEARPETCALLEAVPSINCNLDSPSKVFAMLGMIDTTRFKSPTRLILDRCLNRDMDALEKTTDRLHALLPDVRLLLMANEGCLYQCPYKPAHDAHIAMVNANLCGERTFAMNRDFGCIKRMLNEPGLLLASPFIRPEDAHHYASMVDAIKICGRNRGVPFLKRAITAYLNEIHTGNLLDLMDAMGDLSDRIFVPNDRLPSDYFERVTRCDNFCRECGWCTNLFNELGTISSQTLAQM